MKSLVIISSVINASKNRFNYTKIRSVYTKEERYQQTIKTIDSLTKIQHKEVLFLEASFLTPAQEEELKNKVNYFINLNDRKEIKKIIDGKIKGKGEATQIWEGLKIFNLNHFDAIIKLSGRYWLNDFYDDAFYSKDINIFRESPAKDSLTTALYKIRKEDFGLYLCTLDYCRKDNGMIESNFLRYFANNYSVPIKLGVSGNVSVDGSFIEF